MSNKKSTDIFEFVYTRGQLRMRLFIYLLLYLATRGSMIYFYISWGPAVYTGSILAGTLIYLSGLVFGIALMTLIIHWKATKIDS